MIKFTANKSIQEIKMKQHKLFKNQHLGFWAPGLLFFALQEVPYMVMPFIHLDSNPIMNMQESSMIMNVLEKILGTLCVISMIFIVPKDTGSINKNGPKKIYFLIAVTILLLNYFGWTLYFTGHQSILIMMFSIVMLPPLYYIYIGLWRDNPPLIAIGSLFEIVHFTHVWMNLRLY